MKKFNINVSRGMMLLSLGLAPLLVQAQSLEQLLEEARSVRAEESRLFEQRKTEFNAAAEADQQKMLADVEAKVAALEAEVKVKADAYAATEQEINAQNSALNAKARELDLSGIFGLARQVANDSSSILQQSMINAQFADSGRVDFLRKFSASTGVATIDDLERLWFEIQQEITASGQVATYTGKVVQPTGELSDAKITRIGPFTAIADGRYLSYIPSLSKLNVLPRQLPDEFLEIGRRLQSASSGYVMGAVDPTRGVLTGLYVERPTWVQRIENGEHVNYVILVVGAAGAIAFIFQLFYLIFARLAVSAQMRNLQKPTRNNALGRVLLAFKGDSKQQLEEEAEVAELRISEAVMKEIPKLERFQAFLRLAVAAGPLLGLVGTVVGMIMTFQSITESGSSDPKLMAAGIGAAMIATVLGLGIAVPLLFANALLNSLSRSIVQVLDEQSTGILAENLEKRHHA